ENQGRIEFFNTEVKAFLGDDPELTRAVAALQGYQQFLSGDLQKRADGDWRLGKALYEKKFPLALQTNLTTAQVLPRAEAAFAEAKKGLYATARRLHLQLWPKEPAPVETADAATQKKVIDR